MTKNTPNLLQPVIALILHHDDTGIHSWYEVVYFNEKGWQSYFGSDTFNDGHHVSKWKYVTDIEF